MPDYAPGVPMWVDISSSDLAKSNAFYEALLGWEPQVHRGAEKVKDIGAFCWNELYTRDVPKAQEFYRRAFN
jgi:predicted enzyme related to lactoylglutathione lyase